MPVRIVSGVIAVALLLLFIGPVIVKLKDVALICVAGVGVVMMLYDLWQSLRNADD